MAPALHGRTTTHRGTECECARCGHREELGGWSGPHGKLTARLRPCTSERLGPHMAFDVAPHSTASSPNTIHRRSHSQIDGCLALVRPRLATGGCAVEESQMAPPVGRAPGNPRQHAQLVQCGGPHPACAPNATNQGPVTRAGAGPAARIRGRWPPPVSKSCLTRSVCSRRKTSSSLSDALLSRYRSSGYGKPIGRVRASGTRAAVMPQPECADVYYSGTSSH